MNDPRATTYLIERYRLSGRPVTREDVRVYEAIVGHRANVAVGGLGSRSEAIPTITIRSGAVDMTRVSRRLREMCEIGIRQGVKRPHMAQWLRQMSDEAFRRLDEAQARLSAASDVAGRIHVRSRQAFNRRGNERVYKSVA